MDNTKTIKLFDANNNLVENFDEEIEKVLISVHGEDYYDTNEDLVNTNLIPTHEVIDNYKEEELDKTIEIVDTMVDADYPKINLVEKKEEKLSIKDFAPLLFFILIFTIIVVAGYYFLNTIDLMEFVKS